jgi:hypothetical protein
MKETKEKNLTLIIINSNKFFRKRLLGILIAVVGVLLASVVFARGANNNVLSVFVDIPFALEIVLYVAVFVLIFVGAGLQFNSEKDKGQIQFCIDSLDLAGQEINLANTSITVSLNASQGKGIYERTIKDSGGNNWIEFVQNGEPKKYEFLIPSQKKEEELTGLIDEYRKKGFKVELKASPPSFWEKLSF